MFRRALPYILFALLVTLFLWRPIFLGEALLPGDYLAKMEPWSSVMKPHGSLQWNPLQWDSIAQYYPWRHFYAQSMKSGRIPLWNPYQFSGTPFLANGQSAVMYPFNIVFLIFSPITAFTVFAFIHLFLACAFTYRFLKELRISRYGAMLGGIVFAFSAFIVLWLELPTFVATAIWLPLVLMLINRSIEKGSAFYAVLAGGAMALSVLAGHFQIALYVMLGAMLWWVYRYLLMWISEGFLYSTYRIGIPIITFLVVTALCCAVQTLSSLELIKASHRASIPTPAGYERFVNNAVQPFRFVTAFISDFYGDPSKGTYYISSAADYMEYGLYAGILPLILSILALFCLKKNSNLGFFVVLSIVAFLAAAGTAINYLFYYGIPGFSSFGGPNRILVLYLFAMASLAGYGFDALLRQPRIIFSWKGKEIRLFPYYVIISIFFFIILLAITKAIAAGFLEGRLGAATAAEALKVPTKLWLTFVCTGVFITLVAISGKINRHLTAFLIILITIADLLTFGIRYNPTCPRAMVYPKTELTDYLKSIGSEAVIAPVNTQWSLYQQPKAILPPNAAMVYGIYDITGYDSLFLKSYKEKLMDTIGTDPSPQENGNMLLIRNLSPELSKVANFIISKDKIDGAVRTADFDGVGVYKLKTSLPKKKPDIKYQPSSFKIGLYLSLLGFSTIAAAATKKYLDCRRWR